MIEATGKTYLGSKYGRGLYVSKAKVGKTCFLVGQILGVFPWQRNGGVVSLPRNLHVIGLDSNAIGGVREFLQKTCKAPEEALDYRTYNMSDDARRISLSPSAYDAAFYNMTLATLQTIAERIAKEGGTHAVVISSLTGLAQALERGVVGPPKTTGQGGYADPDKWKAFSHQINEIRNIVQVDSWHTFWEGHVDKAATLGMKQDEAPPKETLHVSGSTGRNFAFNVDQVFRIVRQIGEPFTPKGGPASACDLMYLDTRPAMDFIANGRGFTENLEAKEFDLALAFKKLGLVVGGWMPGGSK